MFHSEPKLWSKFPETKGARKTRFSSRTPNLISCQRIFALIHLFHVHCREVANGSLIVYALTYWSIKSTIFHSWEEPLHHKADQMGLHVYGILEFFVLQMYVQFISAKRQIRDDVMVFYYTPLIFLIHMIFILYHRNYYWEKMMFNFG